MTGQIIDLSANNAHPITFRAIKAAGFIGVVLKATQGTTYTNPYFASDLAAATAAGLPVLAYHYAAFTTPAAEARYFLSIAGARARILDVETSENVGWMNDFLAFLNLPQDEELTYGSAATLPRGGIRSLLWPADYTGSPGFGQEWQFTESGSVPGVSGPVDISNWLATTTAFNVLFGVAPAPAPVPPASSEVLTMACDVPGGGVLVARPTGTVDAFTCSFEGSLPGDGVKPAVPIVGICATETGKGYWLVGGDGGIFAFGDAVDYGPSPAYLKAWGLGVGHGPNGTNGIPIVGIVRGSTPGIAYQIVATGGSSTPEADLYKIPSNGQYAS